MHGSNESLVLAFPEVLREDALVAVAALPESSRGSSSFSATVAGEQILVPYRIYHDPKRVRTDSLSSRQLDILNCLFTRHHDGFVRQRRVEQIIGLNTPWVTPFVVQLVGEYVLEILNVIERDQSKLSQPVYRRFFSENPRFLFTVEQRVISYWNCYHRHIGKAEYVGFRLIRFLKALSNGESWQIAGDKSPYRK